MNTEHCTRIYIDGISPRTEQLIFHPVHGTMSTSSFFSSCLMKAANVVCDMRSAASSAYNKTCIVTASTSCNAKHRRA